MKKYLLGFLTGIMVVTLLPVAFAVVNPNEAAQKFSDVMANDWYVSDLTDMIVSDIIKGYPDGTFRPGVAVNRAEVTAMLSRVKNKVHEQNQDMRYLLCYGLSEKAQGSDVNDQIQGKYEKLKEQACGAVNGSLVPGPMW